MVLWSVEYVTALLTFIAIQNERVIITAHAKVEP